jgi:hypothetical protein
MTRSAAVPIWRTCAVQCVEKADGLSCRFGAYNLSLNYRIPPRRLVVLDQTAERHQSGGSHPWN